MIKSNNGELKRVIGVSGLAFTIVNFVVGAGIFALPAIVGNQLGNFAMFGYLVCGLLMAAIMLCYAEIGSKITAAGGNYAYVKAAFGEFPAYLVNWLFLIGWSIFSDAALMNLFANSLAVMFPVFSGVWARALVFFVLFVPVIIVNILGAREGVMMVTLITILKLLPLFGIIALGFTHINKGQFHWEHFPGMGTFGGSILALFFAFCGFESALNISGELKNPSRTVPLGIMFGGLFVVVFYLLLQFVTQGVLGPDMASAKDAPLAAVAEKLMGSAGGKILLITTAISCVGTVFADILTAPRLLYAGARDGLFPSIFGKTHPKYATPYWAIITYAGLIFIIAVSGEFEQLMILATAAILLIYLSVVLATVKLRRQNKTGAGKTFRMPGGMIFPVIAIVTIGWLLSQLKKADILSTIVFIAIVCVVYFLSKKIGKTGPAMEKPVQAGSILDKQQDPL